MTKRLASLLLIRESDYPEKLSILPDIELIHQLDENYIEYSFFLVQLNQSGKNLTLSPNWSPDFESSVAALKSKILTVKAEIEKRDADIEKIRAYRKPAVLRVRPVVK